MYGLPNKTIDEIKRITSKYNITFIIFGSRARGDFKKNSDIDIAVKEHLEKKQKYEIMNDFDLIDTVYKIDLVFMQDIQNNQFLETIRKEGKEI